jgi:hypothetical protein
MRVDLASFGYLLCVIKPTVNKKALVAQNYANGHCILMTLCNAKYTDAQWRASDFQGRVRRECI